MTDCLVHVFNAGGHRATYRDFLARRLGLDPATGGIGWAMGRRLIRADHLLFGTIGGRTAFKAVLISLIRACRGKRTSAICMGGDWYKDEDRPLRSAVTLMLYRMLDAIGLLKVYSIIPYQLMPDLTRTTSDWILDLCLWDLQVKKPCELTKQTNLSDRVLEVANGRTIVLFLGKATQRKGYRSLVAIARSIGQQSLIVSAGQVSVECRSDADALREMEMIVEDRRITEDELLSLYGVADYVWCRYDESSSSMSSGVFGRAVQLQKTAVVPAGSYLDRLAKLLGHPVVHDLDAEDLGRSSLPDVETKRAVQPGEHAHHLVDIMALDSFKKLASGL